MGTVLTATDFALNSLVRHLREAVAVAVAVAVALTEDRLEALAVLATGQKATSYLYLAYHPQDRGRYT